MRSDKWIKNGTEGAWAKLLTSGTCFHTGVYLETQHILFSSWLKVKAFWDVQWYWIDENPGQIYFYDLDRYLRERFRSKELNFVKVIVFASFQPVVKGKSALLPLVKTLAETVHIEIKLSTLQTKVNHIYLFSKY